MKRLVGCSTHQPVGFTRASPRIDPGRVDDPKVDSHMGASGVKRLGVALVESTAEDLVPFAKCVQGALQSIDVDRTVNVIEQRNIVDRCSRDGLLVEPEQTLCMRERCVGTVATCSRGRCQITERGRSRHVVHYETTFKPVMCAFGLTKR